ncbi:MAG TPA: STAS domain-containing protein [Terriglobales bacterium]|nr:STAS domain-containing protein [Terriglobales bacterium]
MPAFLRKEGDVVIVDLQGRMAMGEVEDFREKWSEAMATGSKELIINLTKVTMMDSSGIGTMIRCHSAMSATGGRIRVVGANTTVRQAFKVTRLDKVFFFYDDEAAALAAKSSG